MARRGRHASRGACAVALTALLLVALLAGGQAAAALPAPSSAQGSTFGFRGCRPAQEFMRVPGLQCATLPVPLSRSEPAGRQLALAVQRIPARGPHTGTLVLLAGGPGQPAIPAFEQFIAPLAKSPQLRGFELVALDQRGTGQSGSLECNPHRIPRRVRTQTAYFGACGEQLGPSRADYTSQESVQDLESLRIALGGAPLSLLAVSYGARVAGMYAREHPQGLARTVLDSPTPLEGDSALGIPSRRALPRVLDDAICGHGACRSFTGDAYEALTRVLATLAKGPVRAHVFDDEGRRHRTAITEARIFTLLGLIDLDPQLRDLVPAALAAAADGRPIPLARLTQNLPAAAPPELLAEPSPSSHGLRRLVEGSGISSLLFAATVCSETELPWTADSQPPGRLSTVEHWLSDLTPGLTAPFSAQLIARMAPISICLDWPATTPPPPPPSGVSAVPTLILGGEDDLRTPFEEDEQIALGYSDVRLLEIPDTGHSTFTSDLSGCASRAAIAFLSSGSAPGSCPASRIPQAIPLPPASLREVHPARSASPAAGRVAAAVAITLEDMVGQLPPGGGGLRGGWWEMRGLETLVLQDLVDVEGVRVSGKITVVDGALRGTLQIRGRLAGSLRLSGRTLRGRLGRNRVQAWLQHI
jgi:pimeloyl-ACP methyl ester carboxylesterase